MKSLALVALLLPIAACKKSTGDSATTVGSPAGIPTGTPGGTTTTPTDVLSAECEVDPNNGLRVWCTAELATEGTAAVELSATDAPTRSFSSDDSGTSVAIFAWGLKPDTIYTWTIGGISGTVLTDRLPANLQGATIDVTGSITGFDAVLLPMRCDETTFAMIDEDGDIVWYEENALYQNGMDAYEWSQADRSLLIGNNDSVIEIGVAGDLRLELGGYAGRAHHDLARWGDYTYVLHDYIFNQVNVDGIHVFEGETLVGTFNYEDHFTVGGFGGDWSHSNGINPTADGHLVVSLLVFDSVMSIDMDPSSPTFMDIDWIAAGHGAGLEGADHFPPAGADEGFEGQHNATYANGKLFVFDNTGDGTESRAARYNLDSASGEVQHEESWGVRNRCQIQGGAVPVPGGVLATCAPSRDVFLFQDGNPDAVFELNAGCSGGGNQAMNRGIPVVIE